MSFATDEREALLGAGRDRSGQAAGGRVQCVFDAKLTPEAVRQRLLPSVRQSRGGDWMLKAKLPAHARFWNPGGTFADRPAELAHCAARVRLRALVVDERHVRLVFGSACGATVEPLWRR